MRTEGLASPRSEQKACSRRRAIKTIIEFSFRDKSAGVRHAYCKECGKGLTRNHYANNKRQYLERNARSYSKRREFVRRTKSRPCADCGVQYPYYVMDFDHREGEVKEYALNSFERMTMRAILREIESVMSFVLIAIELEPIRVETNSEQAKDEEPCHRIFTFRSDGCLRSARRGAAEAAEWGEAFDEARDDGPAADGDDARP
jgi:hypothetical protein